MAAPDTLWKVTIQQGWWTSTTSPPADLPENECVTVFYLNSSVPGYTSSAAVAITQAIYFRFVVIPFNDWFARWFWLNGITATHVLTGNGYSNTNTIHLGLGAGGSFKDLPWNASAFAFGRSKDVGHQTRFWVGGLSSKLLTTDGQVAWSSNPAFGAHVRTFFLPFTAGGRTYDRIIYSAADDSLHSVDETLKVGQFRSIRRRSLTGDVSFSPL